ncbi:MAG TPA: NADP-dependent oxidoreductase [Streptosporangiaceae bacterium]
MRALVISGFGGTDVLEIRDVPVPEPGDEQVRVRVEAAPVHPVDLNTREGHLAGMLPGRSSYVLGWDAAGTIDALGPRVTGLAPGDRVCGMSDWLGTLAGTQAEFVVLDAAAVVRVPASMSAAAASTIPGNGYTAWQALDLLDPEPGERIAVTGAGGAVGGYTLELARARGLEVIGLGSAQDREFVTSRGGTLVERSPDPAAAIRAVAPGGVAGLVDTALLGMAVIGAVRDGGKFIAALQHRAPAPERGVQVSSFLVHSDARPLAELIALADGGVLTPRVAQTIPLDNAAYAHSVLAKGGVRGRLVLVP